MQSGELLGQYRVESALGRGGMGEVYLATDMRLGRQVAIKVLPPEFRDDTERLARLEREARSLASMNHPHIATLFGLEDAENGIRFLVMEFVEGDTLKSRLQRGAMTVEATCEYGAQLADALAAAHQNGILHRDLKSTNVMVTASGVKLLDFGLAKEIPSPVSGAEMDTVALTDHFTAEGVLVGTVPYMSPEQLQGKRADARSDIWALGAVLYEMMTGFPPFRAENTAALISAILEHEPEPLSELGIVVPRALDRLISSCLVKDPVHRRESAHDVALDLRSAVEEDAPDRISLPKSSRLRDALLAMSIPVVIAAGIAIWSVARGPDPQSPVRFSLSRAVSWDAVSHPLAVSSEGELAWIGPPPDGGPRQLWLRRIGEAESRSVPGTRGVHNPFWSPDGRWIGYQQGNSVQILDSVAGGPPRELLNKGTFGAPSWGANGTILFADVGHANSGILIVDADGGHSRLVTEVDPQGTTMLHAFPQFLPDGVRFLFVKIEREDPYVELYIGSVDGGPPRRIEGVRTRAQFMNGYLFYGDQGVLVARRFDPDTAMFNGDPIPLGSLVGPQFARTGFATFSTSANVVAWATAESGSRAIWFDRSGERIGELNLPGTIQFCRISPSGDRVAAEVNDPKLGTSNIWILDVERDVPVRMTFSPADEANPVWSPEGDRLLYTSDESGSPSLRIRSADGSGEAIRLPGTESGVAYSEDWSPDGKLIAYNEWSGQQLRLLSLAGDPKSRSYADGPGWQNRARFSPNGHWVAFASGELGGSEVFIAPLSDGNARQRVSVDGGSSPVWAGSGRELYYADTEGVIYSVAISENPLSIGRPQLLFATGPGMSIHSFDVTEDGNRFLVVAEDAAEARSFIHVLVNGDLDP